MPNGTVKFFNATKGYGFIQPDDGGNDAFVHISAVERSGMTGLVDNQRVAYDLEQDRPGKMSAVNLRSPDESKDAGSAATDQAEPETAQPDATQQDLEDTQG